MIFAVLQSRQMKEVPVRHLSLNSRLGSYSTSFFMTENERTRNSRWLLCWENWIKAPKRSIKKRLAQYVLMSRKLRWSTSAFTAKITIMDVEDGHYVIWLLFRHRQKDWFHWTVRKENKPGGPFYSREPWQLNSDIPFSFKGRMPDC